MRVEPFGVGSIVHVVKRGTRGMDIVRDEADKWRFARLLFLLNDSYQTSHRHTHRHKSDLCPEEGESPSELYDKKLFARPQGWPERDALVSILAWTLLPNHFHLLLYEHREKGVSKFMQRLCGSMSTTFNQKYGETGSIFQGSYKSRTVGSDEYLRYVHSYIVVKNVFDLYPGGLQLATKDFDAAWRWASSYQFSSFRTSALRQSSPIVDMNLLMHSGLLDGKLARDARDMLAGHSQVHNEPSFLILEDW